MASVTKKGKGYLIRISNGKDANGKRIFINEVYYPKAKSETARKNEAQRYADDLERKIKDGEVYNLQALTLNQFFQKWKTELAPHYLTQAIQEQYSDIIEKRFIKSLGNINMTNISPLLLQGIVTKMDKTEGLKSASIHAYFTAFSSLMHQAYNMGIVKENPVMRVMLPKIEKDSNITHTFTVAQSKAFLRALEEEYVFMNRAHERTIEETGNTYSVSSYSMTVRISTMWKAYFNLALFSGARRGEMVALTWEDIDFQNRIISITKSTAITKSGQVIKDPKTKAGNRQIMLPLQVFEKLNAWKQEQRQYSEDIGDLWKGETGISFEKNFIFTQANGKQIDLHTPTHKFREILTMYNDSVSEPDKLPIIKLHDLRHCSASILIASGVDVAEVSRMLGHSKISITLDNYTHALQGRSERISNILENLLTLEEETVINARA